MTQRQGQRRAAGELEAAILDALWQEQAPLTPAQLQGVIDPDLAYNTVHTVLTRMCDKGTLRRTRVGGRPAYEPVRARADHEAARLHAVLAGADDRVALLRRFVDTLDPQDEAALRDLLDRR